MHTDPFLHGVPPGSDSPSTFRGASEWYACRTRARAEKQVDRLLKREGFETFLPLAERQRPWSDRMKRVSFPLFPGYTFVRFGLDRILDVVRTPGVVEVVGRGRPARLREDEIEAVRRLVLGLGATSQEPELMDALAPGIPVRVVEGPFQGLRGFLTHIRGKARVIVRLSAIQMAAGIEVNLGSLERVA